MIKIQTVGSLTTSFSRHGYQREAMTYRRPNLGVDWNSSSGRTCSRFRFRRLWGREDRGKARVSVVKTSGGKKRNIRHCENDLMQSTDQWVCVCVVRLSKAKRESENQTKTERLFDLHIDMQASEYLDGWDNKANTNDTRTDKSIFLIEETSRVSIAIRMSNITTGQ